MAGNNPTGKIKECFTKQIGILSFLDHYQRNLIMEELNYTRMPWNPINSYEAIFGTRSNDSRPSQSCPWIGTVNYFEKCIYWDLNLCGDMSMAA